MSATYEIINIGVLPNDGLGDPLRVAFGKINNNFANLFATTSLTSNATTVGNAPEQVIFSTPVNGFTQGMFQIRSTDPGTIDSQYVTINAQITNDLSNVKFSAYATTFNGNVLTRYNMDVLGGNVRLLLNPLVNTNMFHFINSQVTYQGGITEGIPIQLDGYVANNFMATEANEVITTESP